MIPLKTAHLYYTTKRGINDGKSIIDAVEYAFIKSIFHVGNAQAVSDTIYNAALTGLNIDPVIVAAAAKAEIQKTLMETPWTGDGINLSERLHGVDNRIKSDIISTVSASMRNYDTVKVMTQKLYDGYHSGKAVLSKAELPAYMQKLRTSLLLSMNGDQRLVNQSKIIEKIVAMNIAGIKTPMLRATYKEALQALKSGKAEALEKALWVAAQEKSRYYAERIARTETARAYYDGFMAKIANDKDVVGVKWKLSSRHPFYDICNVYADADFGLGKGIFPKNKVPIIPVHPHCLCHLLEVYEGELDPYARFSWDKGRQYIDKLPEKEQKTLFSKEKLAKYRSGGDWRKLAGDWQGEEFRQSRLAGVDKILEENDNAGYNKKIEEVTLTSALRFFDSGISSFIPKNTVVENPIVIAGTGSNKVLRVNDRLANKYGTTETGWQKIVGNIVSDKFKFDIHWYRHPDVGNVEFKIKNKKER